LAPKLPSLYRSCRFCSGALTALLVVVGLAPATGAAAPVPLARAPGSLPASPPRSPATGPALAQPLGMPATMATAPAAPPAGGLSAGVLPSSGVEEAPATDTEAPGSLVTAPETAREEAVPVGEGAAGGFRTFTLRKPQNPPKREGSSEAPPLPSAEGDEEAPAPVQELQVTSFWRLSGGGISTSLDLGADGPKRQIRSSLAWSGRTGFGLERGVTELVQGRSRFRVGDDTSELYGAVRGMRWESGTAGGETARANGARDGAGFSWGLGVFQPRGTVGVEATRLALDLRWSPASRVTATASAGLDGSWRLGSELADGRVTTALSVGRLLGFREGDLAAVTQYQLTGNTFVFSRLGRWRGRYAGHLSAVGVRTQWRGASLWLEEARGRQGDAAQTQDSLGFFVPGRRLQWGARLQRTAQPDSSGRGAAVTLGADLLYQSSDRLQLWLQSSTSALGEDDRDARLLAGVSFHPSPGLELRAERTVQRGGSVVPWQVLVRRRTGAQTTLGLFYAPMPIRDGDGGARVGVEWGRSFSMPLARSGRIRGQVLVGGEPCRERVAVLLDAQRRAWTDREGKWKFDRVPGGMHTVRLDPARLPAQYDASQSEQTLRISAGRTTEATFDLTELGGILGRVMAGTRGVGGAESGSAVSGEVRPLELGGITVSLSSGQATTTGRDGAFSFRNLPAGPYTIRVEVGTVPEGCELRGPASWDVQVANGANVTGVEFPIGPIRRPIRFFQPGNGSGE
jgi:hypothetical protein